MTTENKWAIDSHSIKNWKPEDYSYEGDFVNDTYHSTPDFFNKYATKENKKNRDKWEEMMEGSGNSFENHCHRCGSAIKYVAVVKHEPTGEYLAIGFTCLENNLGITNKEYRKKRLKERLKAIKTRRRKEETREEFKEEYPKLYKMLDRAYNTPHEDFEFVNDLARKFFDQDPRFSPGMINGLQNTYQKRIEWAEENAWENKGAEDAKVPEGDSITITGKVIKTDTRQTQYGERPVMTVKSEEGWAVWGTQPSDLRDLALNDDDFEVKGTKIKFVADVERADSDDFGFFNNPREFELAAEHEEEAELAFSMIE